MILVPGPEEEQRVVKRMYEMFVHEGRPERGIAEILKRQGQLSGPIIDKENDLPSSSAYRSRFGSLARARGAISDADAPWVPVRVSDHRRDGVGRAGRGGVASAVDPTGTWPQ